MTPRPTFRAWPSEWIKATVGCSTAARSQANSAEAAIGTSQHWPQLKDATRVQTDRKAPKGPTKRSSRFGQLMATCGNLCLQDLQKACHQVNFKPSCQATVAPVVSSAQCRASMENRHWRSQAAHRVQRLMLVARVAVVAMDLSNCQAVCLCGTSSHAGHMGRRFRGMNASIGVM